MPGGIFITVRIAADYREIFESLLFDLRDTLNEPHASDWANVFIVAHLINRHQLTALPLRRRQSRPEKITPRQHSWVRYVLDHPDIVASP